MAGHAPPHAAGGVKQQVEQVKQQVEQVKQVKQLVKQIGGPAAARELACFALLYVALLVN